MAGSQPEVGPVILLPEINAVPLQIETPPQPVAAPTGVVPASYPGVDLVHASTRAVPFAGTPPALVESTLPPLSPVPAPADKAEARPAQKLPAETAAPALQPITIHLQPEHRPAAPEVAPDRTLFWLGCVLGTALLAPAVTLGGLLLALRRLSRGGGPVVRVEYVGGQQSIPLSQLAGLLYGAAPPAQDVPPASVAARAAAEVLTGEHFDLGPTFEEERALREQQGRQQEQGLLQQLFEDNLRLQSQIPETPAEASTTETPAASC